MCVCVCVYETHLAKLQYGFVLQDRSILFSFVFFTTAALILRGRCVRGGWHHPLWHWAAQKGRPLLGGFLDGWPQCQVRQWWVIRPENKKKSGPQSGVAKCRTTHPGWAAPRGWLGTHDGRSSAGRFECMTAPPPVSSVALHARLGFYNVVHN